MNYGHVYPPSTGPAVRIFNLAKMSSLNFQTSVLAILSQREFQFPEIDKEIDQVRIRQVKNTGSRTLMNVSKLINFYYTHYPNAITNSVLKLGSQSDMIQLEGVSLYSAAKTTGKPIVLDMHNVNYELIDYLTGWKKTLLGGYWSWRGKSYELKCMKNAQHIIVTSERDREVYLSEEESLRDKITVIPNCIDMKEYQEEHGDEKPVVQEKPVVLFVGSLNYYPNMVAAYDIMEMAREMKEIVFMIVGAKSDGMNNHPENVMFTGFVEDVKPYISSADICIAPLRFGSGTRIKILEYMAMRKPVITTEKGVEGLEVDRDSVIVENDLRKYKEIIRDTLKDESKRRMLGEKAFREIREKYDWRNYVEELRSIYESVPP